MLKMLDIYFLLCLFGETNALYKRWIPDTNYGNKTNWNTGVVPCGNDRVLFPAQRKVSVYVETTHSVQEMTLPVDGEFILNSGAGFYIGGEQEPGCGTGATTEFKDSDSLQWLNPALWQMSASMDDLENGRYLFSVHEESVPCEYDDVIFKASSSFRVKTTCNNPVIRVKSVSVLGKTFNSKSDFSKYLQSGSGQMQFHGKSVVTVKASGCGDPSGCACGNSGNRDIICASVACPSLTCKKPLRPVGHCCDVCGAIVSIQYATGFNLQTYRQRLQHLFLVQPLYKTIQMGVSKVLRPQYFMKVAPIGASPEIQIVALDSETGPQSGMVAEALARDILNDVHSQGASLGITKAEFQASSGSNGYDGPENTAGVVTGIVFGVLILVTLVGLGAFLVYKGHIQIPRITMPSIPPLPSLNSLKKRRDSGDLGGTLDSGFENPIFDNPSMLPGLPGIYGTEINAISMTQSGVHFVNPVYDDNETDFSI